MKQVCYVSCGLPGEDCACFREHMKSIYADLLSKQVPPDPEIDRVISENIEELYDS